MKRACGAVLLLCGLALVTSVVTAEPRGVDDLQQVLRAVNARQEQVKSFRYRWTCRWLLPRGCMDELHNLFEGMGEAAPAGGPFPPEDIHNEQLSSLIVDGSKVRYDWAGIVWSVGQRQMAPWGRSEAHVDGVTRTLNRGMSSVVTDRNMLVDRTAVKPLLA
ncbi:unnamed protein product, partial [marine sediment metagenome]